MCDVRIRFGEGFSGGWRVALEKQHGTVDRICERTGEHELAACGGRSRVREMILPKRRAFLRVVVDNVVKEKVVHVYPREALG